MKKDQDDRLGKRKGPRRYDGREVWGLGVHGADGCIWNS